MTNKRKRGFRLSPVAALSDSEIDARVEDALDTVSVMVPATTAPVSSSSSSDAMPPPLETEKGIEVPPVLSSSSPTEEEKVNSKLQRQYERWHLWKTVLLDAEDPPMRALDMHRCDFRCETTHKGDLYLCVASGNIHECTDVKCDRIVVSQDSRSCEITGLSYPLDLNFLDCDHFNDISGHSLDRSGGKKDEWAPNSSSSRSGSGDARNGGESVRLPLNAELKRAADVFLKEQTELRERGLMPPPPPRVRAPAKRLTKYEPVAVAVVRAKTQVRPLVVAAKQRQQQQFPRVRPPPLVGTKVASRERLRSMAFGIVQFLIKPPCCSCSSVTYHRDAIIEHCIDLWICINKTAEWQRKQHGARYTFEIHCYTTVFQMRDGLVVTHQPTSTGYTIIPASECVAKRLMTRSELAYQRPTVGTLTNHTKKMKESVLGIDLSGLRLLQRASLIRAGGIPMVPVGHKST